MCKSVLLREIKYTIYYFGCRVVSVIGSGFTVHVTINEANLAPLLRAVNHSDSNDNEGFFEEIKITQEYCSYPIPEKYQLSVVLHQVIRDEDSWSAFSSDIFANAQ